MRERLPDWLKVKLPDSDGYRRIKSILIKNDLHTVCEEANCPNKGECWEKGTATFMILGDTCTRNCRYCSVKSGNPDVFDKEEGKKIAEAVKQLGLKYAVITSVTRDDLDDGGASIFADSVNEIRKIMPDCKVELLIPDFKGKIDPLYTVMESRPFVIGHNIETVRGRFKEVRPQADYDRSIDVLSKLRKHGKGILVKSGIMVGLGESKEEVISALKDLKVAGVDIVTIGQYLQASKNNVPVSRFYHPKEFIELRKIGLDMGFRNVFSAPLVRSSYHAEEIINKE